MTLDECVAKALTFFDERWNESMLDYDALLRARGATDEELEIALAHANADLAADRKEFAATVRKEATEADAWFRRGGTELQ